MKRKDLNQQLLDQTLNNLRLGLISKVNSLVEYSGLCESTNMIGHSFPAVTRIWAYASTNPCFMEKLAVKSDRVHSPEDDIQSIHSMIFGTIDFGFGQTSEPPAWFRNTALGFACKVASARIKLQSSNDLSVIEVSLLSDRKHTTVQQHCQRNSIKSSKGKQEWIIPPEEALRYIESSKVGQFSNVYN